MSMNKNTKLAALAVAAVLVAGSGAAETLNATNPWAVMINMQGFGLVATLESDSSGDPKIASRVSDTKFSVYFYGCEDKEDCTSIQFSAGYDLNEGITAERVNEWNLTKRFAKAYVDEEGDPFLEMDLNMDYEGVSLENFEDSLDVWRLLIEDFEDFIDW